MCDEKKEHYFEIKIFGKSLYDQEELTALIYEFLKGKADFKII